MAHPFSRTLRSLDRGEPARTTALLVAMLALTGGWLAWFVRSELPVYVVSETARLEARRAVHTLTARSSGRILKVAVAVGQRVREGELILELESEVEQRRLEEERARLASIAARSASVRGERSGRIAALAATRRADTLGVAEARARVSSGEAAAQAADDDLERKERLRAAGLVPESDVVRSRAEARQRHAELDERRLSVTRTTVERGRDEGDRDALLGQGTNQIAELEGEAAASRAVVARLETELRWRQIRAPVAGTIGDLARLDAGAMVQAGQRLGSVIPTDTLKVLSAFTPSAALGHIRPGQAAEVRLDGYPWTEYGTLAASVQRVGTELRDGKVWVDLVLRPAARSRIPLQHGLPGSVAIETERLSPFKLLLRTLGRAAAANSSSRGG